jgi:AcrR family transcriptional regulator
LPGASLARYKVTMPSSKRPKRRQAHASQPRRRLSPAVRRAHILDAAAGIVVRQGYLPVSIEQLARAAGTSKALVYTYFPTQFDIFNALLERELTALLATGLDTASQVQHLEQAAVLSAMLYFEHVARNGPLLRILVDDRYMRGHADPRLSRMRAVILHRLARLCRKTLPLTAKEVLAAAQMISAIPEESGRMVFHQELEPAVARQVCRSLIVSALQALRAPGTVLAGIDDVA